MSRPHCNCVQGPACGLSGGALLLFSWTAFVPQVGVSHAPAGGWQPPLENDRKRYPAGAHCAPLRICVCVGMYHVSLGPHPAPFYTGPVGLVPLFP